MSESGGNGKKWDENIHSSFENLFIECCDQIHMGHWELFRCLVLTAMKQDKVEKKVFISLLQKIYQAPALFCNGSNSIDNPCLLYWLCAQFYSEISDDEIEQEFLLADASFRQTLKEMSDSKEPDDRLAVLYKIFTGDGKYQQLLNGDILNLLGKTQLTILVKEKPDLAVTVFEQLLNSPSLQHTTYLADILSCLYDSIDQCLSAIELFNGCSTFDSCIAGTVKEKQTLYKLLYLYDHLKEQILPVTSSEHLQASQSVEMCTSPKIDKLLSRIWHLCERGILFKSFVYYSLLSHTNHWMLKRLLYLEDQTKNRFTQENANLSAENFLRLIYSSNGALNIKELFLYSVVNKTHFLECLLDSCVELIHAGQHLLVCHALQNSPFLKMRPLVLLATWTKVKTMPDIVNFVDAFQLLYSTNHTGDPDLNVICHRIACKAKLVLTMLNSPSWKKLTMNDRDISLVINHLQEHSAVYILHHCSNINAIERKQLFTILKNWSNSFGLLSESANVPETCEVTNLEHMRDEMLIRGFHVLFDLIQIILETNKFDQLIEDKKLHYKSSHGESLENNLHRFYTHHVLDPLNKIVDDVSSIYPLTFRVEVLENAFSLLFLTRQNLEDEIESYSCSSEDGDDVILSAQHQQYSKYSEPEGVESPTSLDLRESKLDDIHHARARGPKEKSSLRNTTPHHSSENTNSCSASSISSNLTRFGFLLNKHVVRSFLNCFKQCIVEASSASKNETLVSIDEGQRIDIPVLLSDMSSISEKSLPVRLSTLFRYITEAQWRYQLVVGDLNSKEERWNSSHSFLEEDSLTPDWSFEFYKNAISDDEEILNAPNSDAVEQTVKKRLTQRKLLTNTRKCNFPKFIRQSSDCIISRMLASPESLLNNCLQQNSLCKADQVIKIFGMEHTSIASEVEFALHYEKTIHDLTSSFHGFNRNSGMGGLDNSRLANTTWKSIVQAAQLGMGAASGETLLADELLASHKVPGVVELENLESSICLSPWLPEPIDWRACVRTDLALVACCNINACRSLLETSYSAFRGNNSSAGRPRTRSSSTKGVLGFIEDILNVISVDVNYDPIDSQKMEYCVGKLHGVHEILCHPLFPLSSKLYKSNKANWDKVEKTVLELHGYLDEKHNATLSNDAGSTVASTAVTMTLTDQFTISSLHPFHTTFQKLIKCIPPLRLYLNDESYCYLSDDAKPVKTTSDRSPAYLMTLLEYAKNLATIMVYVEFDSSSVRRLGYFSMFLQSPLTTIAEILKCTSMSPTELERITQHMNLNLMEIVIHCFCPNIPVARNSIEGCGISTNDENATVASGFPEEQPSSTDMQEAGVRDEIPTNTKELFAHLEEKCWLAVLLMRALIISDDPHDGSASEGMLLCPVLYRYLEETTFNNFLPHKILTAFLPSTYSDEFNSVIEFHLQNQNLNQCLKYLNSWKFRNSDFYETIKPTVTLVLSKLAQNVECYDEICSPWMYIMQIKDAHYKANFVIENHIKWPSEGAKTALQDAISCFGINNNVREELALCLEKVQLYEKIAQALSTGSVELDGKVQSTLNTFSCWQGVTILIEENFSLLMKGLWNSKNYELILKLSKLHSVPEDSKEIVENSFVLSFLEGPTISAASLLKALQNSSTPQQRYFICQNTLARIYKKKTNCTLLLNVLETVDLYGVEVTELHDFLRKKIGIKILMCLPVDERLGYMEFVTCPHVMIEQMLINIKIEALQNAFQYIHDDLQSFSKDEFLSFDALNEMLEIYASKAIDMRVSQVVNNEILNVVLFVKSPEKSSAFELPVQIPSKQQWTPDASVTKCMVCSVERFSMFNRRHHCRRCGRVVCGACSQKKKKISCYGDIAVRVCDDCYATDFGKTVTENALSPATDSHDNQLQIHFSASFESPSDCSNSIKPSSNNTEENVITNNLRLSSDASHNKTVREEFSYEQAPSVSLCLSICDLHWDPHKSGHYLLCLADSLLKLLQPSSPGIANPEIDYNLVISMLICVLLSAKVKFSKAVDHHHVTKCDLYLGIVDILTLLVSANCKHLIPVGDLTDNDTVRKLRDHLMKEERWKLALDISTKGGLDVMGVWSAWGMACLKMGHYSTARKKFAYCLQRFKMQNKMTHCHSLLKQIIDQIMSTSSVPEENEPSFVKFLSRLTDLKNHGCSTQNDETLNRCNSNLHPKIREECLYYIETYGSDATHLSFYCQINDWDAAVKYAFEKKCPPTLFIEDVVMVSIRKGYFSKIKLSLLQMSHLHQQWCEYFEALCRYLERIGYYHTLYDLQIFLKDEIRCALTCIRFYKDGARNYSDLNKRTCYLITAKQHLKCFIQQYSGGSLSGLDSSRLTLKLPLKEVERYLRGIDLQIEVTTFLCAQANQSILHDHLSLLESSSTKSNQQSTSSSFELVGTLPTLLDDASSRAYVVAMVIVNGDTVLSGFSFCELIMREFGLHEINTYSLITKILTSRQRLSDVLTFVNHLKAVGSHSTDVCDRIILKTISAILKERLQFQNKDISMLIKSITDDKNKISAYIQCGKLKAAYLLAVKRDNNDDVTRVLMEAIKTEQTTVKAICEKWLDLKNR